MNEFKWIKCDNSHEGILKKLDGKHINYKFRLALEHNLIWLVEHCIENELDVKSHTFRRLKIIENNNGIRRTLMIKFDLMTNGLYHNSYMFSEEFESYIDKKFEIRKHATRDFVYDLETLMK